VSDPGRPWEPWDYSQWSSLSTNLSVYPGEPGVVEREFGGYFTGRATGDILIGGLLERVHAFGGEAKGYASLWIRDQEIALFPFCSERVVLEDPHLLLPGDKWKWLVEVPDMLPDQHCRVSVLLACTLYWRNAPKGVDQ